MSARGPDRANPFPNLASVKLSRQRMQDGVPQVPGALRTLSRQPIKRLRTSVEEFRASFRPNISDNQGAVAFLRGPHGSGKTHTIFAVWRELSSRGDLSISYALQQNADLLALYADVMRRLDTPLLKQLSEALRGTVTAEELLGAKGDSPGSEQLSVTLQTDPGKVKQLAESYRVQDSVVKVRQEDLLLQLTGGNKDLSTAVRCLQGNQFDTHAAAWLRGETVDPLQLQLMAISQPITTPEQVSASLGLLTALFAFMGKPLVLIVDQCEKLIPEDDPAERAANIGYIRAWMETFAARNGMLILSGSPACWDRLPEDIQQRFGRRVVDVPLLRLDEATDLLRIYVTPDDNPYTPDSGSTYPFAEEGIRGMLALSAGNPRKFLQLASAGYDAFLKDNREIDDPTIRKLAALDASGQLIDIQRVRNEARRALARRPGELVEDYRFAGMSFDFALTDASGDPALLMEIKEAIFAVDESQNALRVAGTLSRLRSETREVVYALVVCGYVSPAVLEHLQRAVKNLVVYSPLTFSSEVERLLNQVEARTPANPPPAEPQDLKEVYTLLRQIADQRTQSSVVVQSREEQSAEHFNRKRYTEQRDEARRKWAAIRRELQDRILKVRMERMQKNLEAVALAVKQANRWRYIRTAFSLLASVLLGGLLMIPMVPVSQKQPSLKVAPVTWALLAVFIGALVFDWLVFFVRKPLVTPPLSQGEVERAALLRAPARIVDFDPLVRLAQACRRLERYPRALWYVLEREPLFLSRIVCCRAAARNWPSWESKMPPKGVVRTMKAEMATLVDELGAISPHPEKDSVEELVKSAPRPVDLVFTLKYDECWSGDRLASVLCEKLRRPITENGRYEETRLAAALHLGLDRVDLTELSMIPERELRLAVREFSPFEADGAGTFDYLSCIEDIDELFLFCSQLVFYHELDLLRYD